MTQWSIGPEEIKAEGITDAVMVEVLFSSGQRNVEHPMDVPALP